MKEQSRVKISRLLFLTLNNTILKTNFICALKLSLIPLFSPYLFPHQDSSHVTVTPAALPCIAISFFFIYLILQEESMMTRVRKLSQLCTSLDPSVQTRYEPEMVENI